MITNTYKKPIAPCNQESPIYKITSSEVLRVSDSRSKLKTMKRHIEKYLYLTDATLNMNGKNSKDWYDRGDKLANLGQYPEALDSFNQAIELQPDYQEAWVFRGVVLIHLQRYQEALSSCNQALEIKPNDSEAWTFRGAALYNLGRKQEAYLSYEKALGKKEPSPWRIKVWQFFDLFNKHSFQS